MTIAEVREKCKSTVAKIPRDMLVIGILILASSSSFGLGYLAGVDAGQGSGVASQELTTPLPATKNSTQTAPGGSIVASKSGTKYYLPSCAAAGRISEANKIWFATPAAATAAGYSPAANCPGL